MIEINENTLHLIKSFEGLSLQSYPDPCSPLARACHDAGVSIYRGQYKVIPAWETMDGHPWTIGFGATHNEDGSPVVSSEVWTEAQAEAALSAEIWSVAGKYLETNPAAEQLTNDAFGALCSFAYNAGIGSLYKSEMMLALRLNKPDDVIRVAWLTANVTVKGQLVPGLVRRRRAESALFVSDYDGMNAAIKG